ncbi:MAG TPA: DUF2213 domain-containing protein [Candidatus Enterenecus merdae]|nr:DUF2213 domain-containing protein [Candidatus Enterenecus merdae]
MAIAYYGTDISPNKTETTEGYLICRNVPIARTGPQEYLARELQLDGDPDRLVSVDRLPEDVFEPATLASFEGKPVTDGHPPEDVGPENYAAYQKGHVQNVRREGDYIVADLYINDANLVSDIQNGVKREVSCGYLCTYEPAGAGYRQTHIRGNHVAVVPKGRAGHAVAIKDAAKEAEKGMNAMNKLVHGILAAFGMAAKDAQPEEMDGLIETTATALDAVPAEDETPAAPEAAPAGDGGDEPPVDDALDKRLAGIEAMLAKLLHKDEPKLADECDIDEMIAKLAGEGEPGEGKALTVPVAETDTCVEGPARDAVVALLRKVRPVVAGIPDKQERAKVTDALLSAISGKDSMQEIAKATADSARAAAQATAQNTYQKICEESEAAYAARNPHNKKEG